MRLRSLIGKFFTGADKGMNKKFTKEELKNRLTPMQYRVTQ